jgi:hypothetical protein
MGAIAIANSTAIPHSYWGVAMGRMGAREVQGDVWRFYEDGIKLELEERSRACVRACVRMCGVGSQGRGRESEGGRGGGVVWCGGRSI